MVEDTVEEGVLNSHGLTIEEPVHRPQKGVWKRSIGSYKRDLLKRMAAGTSEKEEKDDIVIKH